MEGFASNSVLKEGGVGVGSDRRKEKERGGISNVSVYGVELSALLIEQHPAVCQRGSNTGQCHHTSTAFH